MIAHLASVYLKGAPAAPTGAELSTLNKWIESEFLSIPCLTKFWKGDVSLSECKAEFRKSGVLNVSTAHNYHPYLTKSANAKFRAVHDWHHLETGGDDSFNGELITYCHARNNSPKIIHWLLFSEIVLQAAVSIHTGKFQPQKFVKFSGF